MRLLIKEHPWSCLAASFAMALDITESAFELFAGHDGSEIVFASQPEPRCRRAYHISEATYVALRLGFACTPLDLMPAITDRDHSKVVPVLYGQFQTEEWNWYIFDSLMTSSRGVVECRTRLGNGHAMAYERGRIFDPDGREFDYSREACEARNYFLNRLWRIDKL